MNFRDIAKAVSIVCFLQKVSYERLSQTLVITGYLFNLAFYIIKCI